MKSGCYVSLQVVPRYCVSLALWLNGMGCVCWDINLHKQLQHFHCFSQPQLCSTSCARIGTCCRQMRMGLGSGEQQYFFQLAINMWWDAVTQIWALEQSCRGGNLTSKNRILDWLGGLFWGTRGFFGFNCSNFTAHIRELKPPRLGIKSLLLN